MILLDEIEKAHPDVYNILLQVFEDGQLTDGLGNTVDFRNSILIMTSNLGARHLQKRSSLGFQSIGEEGGGKTMDEMVMGEVKRVFNPEFLNRLDEIILFNPLGDEDLLRIIDLLVGQINDTLIHRQVQIVLTPEARQWILEKTCGDRSYGARPLRRALQRYVEDPLSEALIQGGLQRPATLEVIRLRRRAGFPAGRRSNPGYPLENPTPTSRALRGRRGSEQIWLGGRGLDICHGRTQTVLSLRNFWFAVMAVCLLPR